MNSTTPLFFPTAATGLLPYTGKTAGPTIIGQVEVSNSGKLGNTLPDGTLSDFERLLAQITGSDAQKALFNGKQVSGQPASSPLASILGSQTSADGFAPEVINPLIPSTSPYTVWSEQVQTSIGPSPKSAEATSSQFEMDDQGRLLISAQLLSEIFAKLKILQNKEARESAAPSAKPIAESVNSLQATENVADKQVSSSPAQHGATWIDLTNLVKAEQSLSPTPETKTTAPLSETVSEIISDGELTESLATNSLPTNSLLMVSPGTIVSDTSSARAEIFIPESSTNTTVTVAADLSTTNQAPTGTDSSVQANANGSEAYDLSSGMTPYIPLSLQAILATWNPSQNPNSTIQTLSDNLQSINSQSAHSESSDSPATQSIPSSITHTGTSPATSIPTGAVTTGAVHTIHETPNEIHASPETSVVPGITNTPNSTNSAKSTTPANTNHTTGQSTKTTLVLTESGTSSAQNPGATTKTQTSSPTESITEKPQQTEAASTTQPSQPATKSEDLYLRIPLESLPEPLRKQGQGLVLHISAGGSSRDVSAKALGTQVSYNGETFNVEVLTEKAVQAKTSTSGEFPENGQSHTLKLDLQSFLKGEANGTNAPVTTESDFAKAQRELIVETHRERKSLPPEAAKAERKEGEALSEAKIDRSSAHAYESSRTSAQPGDRGTQSTQQSQATQQTQTTSYAAATREAIERYQQISQQIVRSVNSSFGEGRSHVTIRLVPESLGQVDVRLTLDSGVLTARLWANNHEARQLLEQHAGQLRASLEESGVRVDRVVVARETSERHGYQREQSDQERSYAQHRQQSNQQQQRNEWNDESHMRHRERPIVSFEEISKQEISG